MSSLALLAGAVGLARFLGGALIAAADAAILAVVRRRRREPQLPAHAEQLERYLEEKLGVPRR